MSARLAFSALLLVCTGCMWGGDDGVVQHKGPALGSVIADLPAVELTAAAPARPSRAEVMAAYRMVYGQLRDPGCRIMLWVNGWPICTWLKVRIVS